MTSNQKCVNDEKESVWVMIVWTQTTHTKKSRKKRIQILRNVEAPLRGIAVTLRALGFCAWLICCPLEPEKQTERTNHQPRAEIWPIHQKQL